MQDITLIFKSIIKSLWINCVIKKDYSFLWLRLMKICVMTTCKTSVIII